jgi:ADP-heptose:LPS heptosyltransferase
MASVLAQLPQAARVAVVRLRSLGDCVLTTPALELLKRCRPDLRVAVVVEDRFRAVFEGNPDVEALLRPEIAALRGWRPSLCLNLHGGLRSAMLTAMSAAAWRAGFAHFRNSFVYNRKIPTTQEILQLTRKVHTAEHLASAIFYLGGRVTEIPRAKLFSASPRLPVSPSPRLPTSAVIHPFASAPEKIWPAERFLAIAKHMEQALDLEPIFIGGATDDLTPFRGCRTLAGAPLAEIKSLTAGASVFLGNDSGPAHIAAAFGIPVVALFGSSDPLIWGPWRTPSEILTSSGGINGITGEQVIAALARLRVHA